VLTIFNTCVPVDSQETCDRLKKVCEENGLPIWDTPAGFIFNPDACLCYSNNYDFNGDFAIYYLTFGKTRVTETEFMELLKEYKKQ